MKLNAYLGIALAVLLTSCNLSSERSPVKSSNATAAELAALDRAKCVEEYDPSVDYFPVKVEPQYAQGFSVDYHNHYKVVTVRNPWRAATQTFQYVLVQCGTPTPAGYPDAQVIQVPVERVVALSTTHLPHLDALDAVDQLVGVSRFHQVNTPSIRRKIDRKELVAVDSGQNLNIEALLDSEPDLVLTFGTGDPQRDTYPKLLELGIPVGIVAEYMEATPLGQSEWLKFTALFLNREAQAEQVFTEIAQEYQALVELAQAATDRPQVFTGFSLDGTWYVPAGQSFVSQFIQDAGADYLWAAEPGAGSVPFAFETVFDQAQNADFWINVGNDWHTHQDAIAADPRYGNFKAFDREQIFNNNAKLNATGGNDYWESGVLNPQVILADLIYIFHPELLPNHELVYYQKLE